MSGAIRPPLLRALILKRLSALLRVDISNGENVLASQHIHKFGQLRSLPVDSGFLPWPMMLYHGPG